MGPVRTGVWGPFACLSKTLALLWALCPAQASADRGAVGTKTHHILILHSYHQSLRWVDKINEGIRGELSSGVDGDVQLHFHYLDSKRTPHARAMELQRSYLERRLQLLQTRFALVITADNNALRFMVRHRRALLPDTPVVFCGVNNFERAMLGGHRDITGVVESVDHVHTFELMRRLQPQRTRVVIVSDATPTGAAVRAELAKLAPRYRGRLTFEQLPGATLEELSGAAARLDSRRALIYMLPFNRDQRGNYSDYAAAITALRKRARVPIFTSWDLYLGRGVVGGMLITGLGQGRQAARLAKEILAGRPPSELAVVTESPSEAAFDYAQLSRFGIDMSLLPPGSNVIGVPASFYARNRSLIIGSLVAGLLMVVLLCWRLIVQRARQRELEAVNRRLEHEQRRLVEANAELSNEQQRRRSAESSREHLLAAIDQTDAMVLILDDQKRVVFANPTVRARCATDLRGVPTGCPMSDLPLLVPLISESIWEELLAAGTWRGTRAVRCPNRPADPIWHADLALKSFRSADYRRFTIAIVRDISHEIELEAKLQHAQQRETIGTLTTGIAHDFGNLLTPILALSREAHASCASPELAKTLGEITSAAERGRQLVRSLMTFSRGTDLSSRKTHVAQVIEEALSLLRSAMPPGVTIEHDLTPRDAQVEAEPMQLHQIMMNLGTNAGHAMRGRGGLLRVSMELCRDEAGAEKVRLVVTDTGCGMPAKLVARIFDPFFSTKPAGEGTGLGLASVHGIVRGLGGEISVESTPGQGTTFTVHLPLAGRAPERKRGATDALSALSSGATPAVGGGSASESDDAAEGGALRLLVVDDEPSVLRTLRRVLARKGFAVSAVESAHEALALLARAEPFDLLISDLTMPEMDGLALAREVRERWPTLPMVIATARLDAIEGLSELGVPRLAKPLELDELERVIETISNSEQPASQRV